MNKAGKIILAVAFIIFLVSDHILGMLSRTRIMQCNYLKIRCFLWDFEYCLLGIIALLLIYYLAKFITNRLVKIKYQYFNK